MHCILKEKGMYMEGLGWGGRAWEFGIDMYIPFSFRMQCMELNATPRGVYLPALGKVFCYPYSGHFH